MHGTPPPRRAGRGPESRSSAPAQAAWPPPCFSPAPASTWWCSSAARRSAEGRGPSRPLAATASTSAPPSSSIPVSCAEIFAACGEDFDDHVELRRLDPLYKLVFEGGGELEAAADPERLAAGIARFAPDDARNIGAFLADNRVKLKAFQPVLERPFGRLADYLAPEVLKALRLLRPHRTVDHDLGATSRDPRVRLAFSFQTKYLGMSPFRCPSLFTILSFLEYEHGVYHPIGGCGAVSEAMARLARRLGADIRLRTSAERVEFAAGAAGRRSRPAAVASRSMPSWSTPTSRTRSRR